MRFRLVVILCCCVQAALCLPVHAERPTPYKAHISTDDVYVRSGPGKNYYPTGKFQKGDEVEVYRHDPGGWYAIRPPKGSFAWVSGRYLELGDDGLAKVTGDRVAARVGSQFSDIRDVIQVRLHLGETVEVLGEKEFASGSEAGKWYKIAPPSGEFRWVFGKYVDPDYLSSGVREAPAGHSPLVAHAESSSEAAEPRLLGELGEDAEERIPVNEATSPEVKTVEHWADASEEPSENVTPAGANSSLPPDTQAAPAGSQPPPTYRSPRILELYQEKSASSAGISPEEFQAELDDLDLELSIMLVEEPTVWQFDELELRARSLLPQVETALERGRVRLLINKLAQSADIKQRYNAVNSLHTVTERHNRQLAKLGRVRGVAGSQGLPGAVEQSLSRFDGVGRLARVVTREVGAPRYALVDEHGKISCYVTPAPDVNMQYYVGRRIGINGIRGYLAEQDAQHVTAKHVMPLGDSRLR